MRFLSHRRLATMAVLGLVLAGCSGTVATSDPDPTPTAATEDSAGPTPDATTPTSSPSSSPSPSVAPTPEETASETEDPAEAAAREEAEREEAERAAREAEELARVKAVQERLGELGYYDGPIDGDLEAKPVVRAVRDFQSGNDLVVDGVFGPKTEAALSSDDAVTAEEAEHAANVRAQQRLRDLGYYDGGIDGDVGPLTKAAVRAFQEVNGLAVDGVIGRKTTAALFDRDAKPAPEPEESSDDDEGDEGDEGGDADDSGDSGGVMDVAQAKTLLADMAYFAGSIDGEKTAAFASALQAFQKVNGLAADGVLGPKTSAALRDPRMPSLRGGPGTRIEVDMDRQVVHLVAGGERRRTMPTSTGNGELYETSSGGTAHANTPVGTFTIIRRVEGLRVSDLGELWDPLYFHGGFAIHGSPSVPPYEASHGCVRLSMSNGKWLASQVANGTTVILYGGQHVFTP